MLHDQAKDQFAFAPGVTGVHEGRDILALEQFDQSLQAIFALGDGPQVEVGRHDGQMREAPLAALDFEFLRTGNFKQMTDRRRNHKAVGFIVIASLDETAQRLGYIQGDGRLFSNDECF